MLRSTEEIYEFGPYRLDVGQHRFERSDGVKNGALREKAFQTLVFLVRNNGRLVTKAELLEAIWPDTAVEENNLNKSIHVIRHALGEDPRHQNYIETVPKHGYRFIADVQRIDKTFSPEAELDDSASSRPPEVLTNGYGASYLSFDPMAPKTVQIPQSHAGSQIPASERTKSSLNSRRKLWMAMVIAGCMIAFAGAGYYLQPEQTVGGDKALIRFDSAPDEVEAKRGTNNETAYEFYLQALNLSEERGVQNVMKSFEYLEKAVALDPNYALAWADKALIHGDIVGHTDSGQHEHYQSSMEAIRKALSINPMLSHAYSALCHNKNRYEYDFAGAETACKRAIELDPNSAVARRTYANFLFSRGRFDDSIVEIKTAIDLRPVSYRNQQIYALALYYARRYGEAEEQFKRLIELHPNHSFIHGRLIRVLEEQGKESEAFEYFIEELTFRKTEQEKIERYNAAYRSAGWRGVTIERIRSAEADPAPRSFGLACLYAKIGDKNKAFDYLERAYKDRSFLIAVLTVEPQLDLLRDDPRFADLIKRVEGK